MERFSTLHGTNQYGSYVRIGSSQKLADFLTRKIGGANALDVIDAVENTLKAFEALSGFEAEPRNLRPMAIRYAPMYLYKKPNMPDNMKEFCALCVNGHEGRPERFTTFTHTTVFPFELMHKSGEYNYLDQIFGTYLLTVQDLALSRDAVAKGKASGIDFDKLPTKVLPVMRRTDMLTVLKIAEAIYTGKNVVIRLEEGFSFHTRAWELLMQVYSLLYPKLATETGFSIYEKPEAIAELCRTTGIRIFVEPAGVELGKLAELDLVILDLNNPASITMPQNSEVLTALQTWYKMPWQTRQKVMEQVFAGVESIRSTDTFVQLTGEYVQALREKDEWLANAPQNLTSMAEVAAYLTKGTFWKKLPDAEAVRKAAAAKMLRPGLTVEMLNADSAVAQYFAPEGSREKKAADVYCQVGSILGGVDPKVLREKTARQQEQVTAAKYTGEIQALNTKLTEETEKHGRELSAQQVAHEEAQARLKQECAQALQTQQMTHKAALAEKEGQLLALTEAHARNIDDLNRAHTEETTALTNERDTAQRELGNAQRRIVDMEAAHKQAMEDTLRAAQQAQSQAVFNAKAVLRQELEAQHQVERGQLEAHYNGEIRRLQNEHATALEQERQRAIEAQREATRLQRRLDAMGSDPSLEGTGYEYTDLGEEQDTTEPRNRGGKFDKKNEPAKMDTKPLIIGAAIGAVIGLILGIVIMLGVNAMTHKPEETIPTTDPVATTAPLETTGPVETTVPVETTEPVETTLPEETTQPEETTAPTEPGEVAKPEIDWTTVSETTGLAAAETDETNVGNLLNDVVLDADAKPIAIVTVNQTGFVDELGVRVRPKEYAVLLEKTGEAADPQTAAEGEKLEDRAALILESTHYRLVIVGELRMQQAAMKLFALAVPENDPAVSLRMKLADGKMLALEALLKQVLTEQTWWTAITDVAADEASLKGGEALLSSRLVPVAAVNCGNERIVYVYDYTAPEEQEMADAFVANQTEKGRVAAASDYMVAVVVSLAQG